MACQLGREPSVRFEVVSKCVHGWPSVIRNDPLDLHGEPHPNLYYLTCPWLRRKLARLEDSGFIGKLQLRIAASGELLEDLRRCQARHAADYRSAMEEGRLGAPPREMLIAGASDPELIKCLHSHMAWVLVNPEYLAGQEVAAAAGELWCPDDRCATWINELNGSESDSQRQDKP